MSEHLQVVCEDILLIRDSNILQYLDPLEMGIFSRINVINFDRAEPKRSDREDPLMFFT